MIEAKGVNGQLTFDGATVTISRQGALSRMTVGKGAKSIPVQHITAIQIKPATALISGFIQFTLAGGNERRSKPGRSTQDAARDENSVVFKKAQATEIEAFAAAVQERINAQGAPVQQAPAGRDVASQIRELAELHAQGALSDEEFASAKANLIG